MIGVQRASMRGGAAVAQKDDESTVATVATVATEIEDEERMRALATPTTSPHRG